MRILVTGGLGFIGVNFVKMLLERTMYDIVILDDITYAANILFLEKYQNEPRLTFYKGNIADTFIWPNV